MAQDSLKPFAPPPSPFTISVDYSLQGTKLKVKFSLKGDIASLNLPTPSKDPQRIEGLYHHTCLEVFLKKGERYLESNFSFSGDWCLFLFDGYRIKSNFPVQLDTRLFNIDHMSRSKEEASLGISLNLEEMGFLNGTPIQIGISAVLEHPKNILSYWALKHTEQKPDFHRAESFIGKL